MLAAREHQETQGITNDGTAQWTDLGNLFSLAQYVALGNGAAGQGLVVGVTIVDSNNNIQTGENCREHGSTDTDGSLCPDCGHYYRGWNCDLDVLWKRECLHTEGYVYYSAFFTVSGQFSNLSPAAEPTGAVMGVSYSATIGNAGSSDPQVIENIVFRTVDGGVNPFAKIKDGSAVENANTSWTLTDTTADRLLDLQTIGETALRNSPPPTGLINLTFHLEGSGEVSAMWSMFPILPISQLVLAGKAGNRLPFTLTPVVWSELSRLRSGCWSLP